MQPVHQTAPNRLLEVADQDDVLGGVAVGEVEDRCVGRPDVARQPAGLELGDQGRLGRASASRFLARPGDPRQPRHPEYATPLDRIGSENSYR